MEVFEVRERIDDTESAADLMGLLSNVHDDIAQMEAAFASSVDSANQARAVHYAVRLKYFTKVSPRVCSVFCSLICVVLGRLMIKHNKRVAIVYHVHCTLLYNTDGGRDRGQASQMIHLRPSRESVCLYNVHNSHVEPVYVGISSY